MAKTPMLERKVASAAQSLEDGEASLAEASAMLAAKQVGGEKARTVAQRGTRSRPRLERRSSRQPTGATRWCH